MPLHIGAHHSNLSGLSEGDPHKQYALRTWVENVSATFVPATRWGAFPDTGNDMTAAIQAAFNGVAAGETLYFQPGTYLCSDELTYTTPANLWAYGAVFSFGTTALTGPAITFGGTTTQLRKTSIRGLQLIRSYTHSLSTTGSGIGIQYTGALFYANNQCRFEDLVATGWNQGFRFEGHNGGSFSGCSENIFSGLRALDCRYSYTLEQSGANAFVNENTFSDCEHQHSTSFDTAELIDPTNGIQMCRLIWGASSNPINNNRFIGCNFEAPSGKPAYRKVVVEGRENYWLFCRWETHGTTDITIGKAATSTSEMTRNVFFHGSGMQTIVENVLYEFIGTTTVNNKNQLHSGWGTIWSGGNNQPAVSFAGGSDTTPLIEVKKVSGSAETVVMVRAAPSVSGTGHGAIEFFDNSTTVQNWVYMLTSAIAGIYDIGVRYGFRVGDAVRMFPSGATDVHARPISSSGRLISTGSGTVPPLAARNDTSSSPSFGLYTGSDAQVLFLVANPNAGEYGGLVWYDASTTERNRMFMESTSPYKLRIHKGLRVNASDTVGGDFEWMDGAGTPTVGFKLNTSSGRVEWGGITPGALDGKLSGLSLSLGDFLDIYTTSVSASGALNSSLCYVGLTAGSLTVTLPAVAGVRDGRLVVIKDESGLGGHTIDGNASETIDGALTQALGAYGSMTIVKRNGAWWIV